MKGWMNNTMVHNEHTALAKHALGSVPIGLTLNLESKLTRKNNKLLFPL